MKVDLFAKPTLISILGIVLISLFGLKALFAPGFYTSHDGISHLSRIAQYTTAIKEGQIPPRWAGTLNGHLGYPVFVYSYHLPYILGSAIHMIGFSLNSTLKILIGLSYVFSGVGMYFFLKRFFSAKASFLGSVIYMYAPFWFLLLFVRVALGEHMAFALVPWVMYAAVKFSQKPRLKSGISLAILSAMAILSHPYFLPIYFPLVFSVLTFCHFSFRSVKLRVKLSYLLLVLVLSLALSAFQLAPQLLERDLIIGNKMHNEQYKYLISLRQFIYSPWGVGFDMEESYQDGISFQLGLTQWLVLGLTGAVLITLFLSLIKLPFVKKFYKLFLLKPKQGERQIGLTLLALLWFITTLFLILDTVYGRSLWRNFWYKSGIEFPWRYIPVAVIAVAICAAFITERIRFSKIFIPVIILLAMVANRNHIRPNLPQDFPDSYYYEDTSTTTYMHEFNPKWRQAQSFDTVEPRFVALGEPHKLEVNKKSNINYYLHTTFLYDQPVQTNILYFPGWHVYIQKEKGWEEMQLGKEIKIVDSAVLPYTKDQLEGTMQIAVPGQEQAIRVEYHETADRKLANIISAWALLSSILLLLL